MTVCLNRVRRQLCKEGIFPTTVRTTSGLERHHKLKYSFLSNTSNGSLSELVSTTVKDFIPSRHRRRTVLTPHDIALYKHALDSSISIISTVLYKLFALTFIINWKAISMRCSGIFQSWPRCSVHGKHSGESSQCKCGCITLPFAYITICLSMWMRGLTQ